jgi:hypothetical protein
MADESFRNLSVYDKAFALAMEIFRISKAFPKEETYSLTSQIRKSSRSVCSSIGEAYRKRQYPAHFVSKSSDGDSEKPVVTSITKHGMTLKKRRMRQEGS